jgi:hypothetical protein
VNSAIGRTTVAPAADKRTSAGLEGVGDRWRPSWAPRNAGLADGRRWNALGFSGQHLIEQCAVGHGFRDRPRRIEGERQRQHTVKRYTPGGTLFRSLPYARAVLEAWRADYNTERPHSRLGWMTPASYAAARRSAALRYTDGSSQRTAHPVAFPAVHRVQDGGSF